MSEAVMQVRLQAAYGSRCVLSDVQFELRAGEALGMIGTSGAGKTTLAMALMGLLEWRGGKTAGEITVDGENLLTMTATDARRIRGKKIALVPQSPMTALNAAVSLRSHFEEAWRAHESAGRMALDTRLRELMKEVQLPGDASFLRRRPGQISVGQAQRVLIALALLHRPSVLIADEPTSALDPVTQAEIVALLHDLNRRNKTALLYISHDLVSVLQLCDRLAVLDGGRLVECIAVNEIEQARHAATLSLLRALPVPVGVLLAHGREKLAMRRRAGTLELARFETSSEEGSCRSGDCQPEDKKVRSSVMRRFSISHLSNVLHLSNSPKGTIDAGAPAQRGLWTEWRQRRLKDAS
jgi:ABC-type glutathione transport system ATPase component